jgi:hypothetical protein
MLPGIHVYEDVPFAVSVVLSPSQMIGLDADEVTVGCEPTVTVTVSVLVHPLASVPVTVYVVVAAGVTTTLEPLTLPGIQL